MPTPTQGFLRPTTTPTPDELFDIWLPRLSGAQLKVLLYIVRRTFGFKKDADAISLAQVCEGITTHDGRALDHGTGLSRSAAYQAIQKLEALGLIQVSRSQTPRGDNAVNVYSLRFRAFGGDEDETQAGSDDPPGGSIPDLPVGDGEDQGGSESGPPVGQKVTQGGLQNDPRVGQKEDPQQTDSQQAAPQETATQQTAPAPPARAPAPALAPDAAGGAGDSDIQNTERPSTEGLTDSDEAIRELMAFGVWGRRARQLVEEHGLTADLVRRACAAMAREQTGGRRLHNPPALLISRLEEGWSPPEIAESPLPEPDEESYEPPPEPQRPPLPPIVDSRGREYDVRVWFQGMLAELSLAMPRETFDAWLRRAELADFRPADTPEGGEVCALTIRLDNRYAYEWVSCRMHKVIQRTVDTMLGAHASITYTAPHLEAAGQTA